MKKYLTFAILISFLAAQVIICFPKLATAQTSILPEIEIGDTSQNQIILTFDSGGGSGDSTQEILTALDRYGIKSTFFLTGEWVQKNQELTKQIAARGHKIHNHTFNHPYLTQISDQQIVDELKTTDDLIFSLIGASTKPYFRTPYGDRDERVLQTAANSGYQSVFWTTSAWDWKESEGITAQQVENRILSSLKPGAIYLMHLNTNISGQIIEDVIQKILARGYKIVSLEEGIK